MVNHWLGVVHPYSTIGLLLICYGGLPWLIDPLCRKVLNKHAVQLQAEESQALHRGSSLRTRFRTCVHPLCWKVLRSTFPHHHCKHMHVGTLLVSDLLVSFRCGLMMAMARQKLCMRRQATWSFQLDAQCSKPCLLGHKNLIRRLPQSCPWLSHCCNILYV